MKIAFPTMDTDGNKNILANGLSATGYLCLYDCESMSGEWLPTLKLAPNMGELLPELSRQRVHVIITEHIHPMALKVLVGKGFEVFKATSKLLDENLHFYLENKLTEYSYESAMELANVCDAECSSCSTECKSEESS